MGSFNVTCQISQLPIRSGQKVRYMLLTKNPYRMDSYVSSKYLIDQEKFEENCRAKQKELPAPHESIYRTSPISDPIYNFNFGSEGVESTDFWFPQFVPIVAKYNDYGRVSDISQKSLQWKFWKQQVLRNICEENPYLSLGSFDSEQLLDEARQGKIRFKHRHYTDKPVPVCQTMILEDVYQKLLAIRFPKNYFWKEDVTPKTLFKEGMSLFKQDFNEKPIEYDDLYLFPNQNNVENHFAFNLDDRIFNGLKYYRSWIYKEYISGSINPDSQEFKIFVKDIADFIYINLILDGLRKCWHPGVGMGSQSTNYLLYKSFHDKINLALNKAKKGYKEFY